MDAIPEADESQEYSTAVSYVIEDAATESDAREAAEIQFRESIEHTWLIKDLESFVRIHPKGYEVAVIAEVAD